MNVTFELNGKSYKTDKETLDLLTKLNKEEKYNSCDMVFGVAIMTGRIVEIK